MIERLVFVLRATRNLSQTFVGSLHLRKSVADELAETILKARYQPSFSTATPRSYEGTRVSTLSSKSIPMMHRMVDYLSRVDWRIFRYITKEFLPHGENPRITGHALEFSSALLVDLM